MRHPTVTEAADMFRMVHESLGHIIGAMNSSVGRDAYVKATGVTPEEALRNLYTSTQQLHERFAQGGR